MTKLKKSSRLIFYIFIIMVFMSSNIVCYANDKYLDNSFWDSIQNTEKSIIESHFGNSIKIKYNCSTAENGNIGLYVDIGKLPNVDSLESLHPKVSYYIHNNNDDISAILSNDSTIQSNNIDLIKDYGINFSTFNKSYRLLSFVRTNKLNQNSCLSAYITIDDCRYKLFDNIKLYDYLYNGPSGNISEQDDSKSTTKYSVPEKETNKDKNKGTTSTKPKQQDQKTTKKGSYNNSSSNNKKYSNQSSNNNYLTNQEQSSDEAQQPQNSDDISNVNEIDNNNSRLSSPSKIALLSGAVIAIIGITVTITSIVFYRGSKDKD